MNEILDHVFLGNTVRSYCFVVLAITFLILFRRLLSKYIASLLYLLIKNTWKNIKKEEFVALIVKPLGWFITVAASILIIDKLDYPDEFEFNIYRLPISVLLHKISICLLIIFFFKFIIRLIDFIAILLEHKARKTSDKNDDQVILFFKGFLKTVLVVLAVLLILKAGFNSDIGRILTGLSIVGAALALAAKESLENLIASIIIFFDKPFYTGDTLKVNNITGTVEHIGLRSTRIRTLDKTLVSVPNKQMADSIIDNYSMRLERRAEIKLEFNSKTSNSDIKQFIQDADRVLKTHQAEITNFAIHFSELNKQGITITIEYFTVPFSMSEFNNLKQIVNFSLKDILEKQDIALATGSTDLHIIQPELATTPPRSGPSII